MKSKKRRRAEMVKELKLSPEKAKDFNALGDKYAKDRQQLFESVKKSHAELKTCFGSRRPR